MTLAQAIEILKSSGVDSPEYDARELFRAYGGLKTNLITPRSESE